MTRKPRTPNWSRLARTARVEASRLPLGGARDALIAKARKLEAAGERQSTSSRDIYPLSIIAEPAPTA